MEENIDNYLYWNKDYSMYDYYYKLNNIPIGWKKFFNNLSVKNEIKKISDELCKKMEKNPDLKIYPEPYNIFNAFILTPIKNIRVYIGAQDPYINPNAAVGVAFSVGNPDNINPSLMNIMKKIENEIYIKNHKYFRDNSLKKKTDLFTGNLFHWAKQGVFLINAALTVEKGKSNSHASLWKKFFDLLITYIVNYFSRKNIFCIYLLMGKFSQNIIPKIINGDNEILACSHPSPLGCNKRCGNFPSFNETVIFSRINEILKTKETVEIQW